MDFLEIVRRYKVKAPKFYKAAFLLWHNVCLYASGVQHKASWGAIDLLLFPSICSFTFEKAASFFYALLLLYAPDPVIAGMKNGIGSGFIKFKVFGRKGYFILGNTPFRSASFRNTA